MCKSINPTPLMFIHRAFYRDILFKASTERANTVKVNMKSLNTKIPTKTLNNQAPTEAGPECSSVEKRPRLS